MPGYQVFIFILIIVLIIGLIVWAFAYGNKTLKSGKGLINEVAPAVERYATVMEKYPEERWGNSRTSEYNLRYILKFKDDSGVITSVSVPPEIYEEIQVGSRDILITQNDIFYDFGGRYGQDIQNDE